MIKHRIIQVLEDKKIPKEEFYQKIGVSSANFRGKAKDTPLNSGTIENILSLIPDINPSWLLTGEGTPLKSNSVDTLSDSSLKDDITKITNYKPTSSNLIPFWDIDFIAGNAFDTVDIKRSKPDYYMDIPDFRGCTAFRAYSDSMEGLIKSGSVLFGTKVENWTEHLEYGQIYGIVCQDGRKYLKYIKKYREDPHTYFLLESENKFYDEFEMPKEAIRSIWLIHGHLSKRI